MVPASAPVAPVSGCSRLQSGVVQPRADYFFRSCTEAGSDELSTAMVGSREGRRVRPLLHFPRRFLETPERFCFWQYHRGTLMWHLESRHGFVYGFPFHALWALVESNLFALLPESPPIRFFYVRLHGHLLFCSPRAGAAPER